MPDVVLRIAGEFGPIVSADREQPHMTIEGDVGLDVFGARRTSPDDMRDDGDPIF